MPGKKRTRSAQGGPPQKKAKTELPKKMNKKQKVEHLCAAAFEGDIANVKAILNMDMSLVDVKNERGQTALYCAARNGNGAIAKTLLDCGADSTIPEANGSTPLHAAAYYGHLVTVEAMAKAGVDITVKNKHGLTAEQEAENPEIKEFLKNFGGAATGKSKKGKKTKAAKKSAPTIDYDDFWSDGCPPGATAKQIKDAEKKTGYKLPEAYVKLLKIHDGGTPKRCLYLAPGGQFTETPCDIDSLLSIQDHLNDETASWCDEWEYPDIGLVLANCPSGGHDLVWLDYRDCGPQGEPKVVHVDQEGDFEVTPIADTFADYIAGLKTEEEVEQGLGG